MPFKFNPCLPCCTQGYRVQGTTSGPPGVIYEAAGYSVQNTGYGAAGLPNPVVPADSATLIYLLFIPFPEGNGLLSSYEAYGASMGSTLAAWLATGGKRLFVQYQSDKKIIGPPPTFAFAPSEIGFVYAAVNSLMGALGAPLAVVPGNAALLEGLPAAVTYGYNNMATTELTDAGHYLTLGLASLPSLISRIGNSITNDFIGYNTLVTGGDVVAEFGGVVTLNGVNISNGPAAVMASYRFPAVNSEVVLCGGNLQFGGTTAGMTPFLLNLAELPVP